MIVTDRDRGQNWHKSVKYITTVEKNSKYSTRGDKKVRKFYYAGKKKVRKINFKIISLYSSIKI